MVRELPYVVIKIGVVIFTDVVQRSIDLYVINRDGVAPNDVKVDEPDSIHS